MRIVVDAMGSDNFPVPDVEGAVQAAYEFGDTIILVGDETLIRRELAKHKTDGAKIEVVHAPENVLMTDKPASVGKEKPQSSMHIGMNLVKDGKADAFVSAGNTGAALAIATLFTLGRIRGVKRPALSSIVKMRGQAIILLDIGANVDCKPEWLVQFALMGKIYAQKALGLANPRIGLLANGEEDSKGNQTVIETHVLLRQNSAFNFVGNIEPKQALKAEADVIVSDGFVGNIAIKSIEAMGKTLTEMIRTEIKAGFITSIGGLLAKAAFKRVAEQVDPYEIGGAPLLGIDGVVIIGHGSSNAKAIKNAVRQARLAVSGQVVENIRAGVASSA